MKSRPERRCSAIPDANARPHTAATIIARPTRWLRIDVVLSWVADPFCAPSSPSGQEQPPRQLSFPDTPTPARELAPDISCRRLLLNCFVSNRLLRLHPPHGIANQLGKPAQLELALDVRPLARGLALAEKLQHLEFPVAELFDG